MYNLNVLNDKEFEDLCQDLLERELKLTFQNFKKGRDGGIDLRHASDSENKIIVQAKHYPASKFSNLKHDLIKVEKPKIECLIPIPTRYIVFTSIALSPQQTDEIFKGLQPFVNNSNDIFGLDRINALLRNHPEVIEMHFKLWMSSSAVLQRILHNGIKGRSEFYKEKIIRKLSLYVPTQNYHDAFLKLKRNKFIIITGAESSPKNSSD